MELRGRELTRLGETREAVHQRTLKASGDLGH